MKKTFNRKSKKLASSKKDNADIKKVILIGAGITATGVAGYFGYQYYKKWKEQQDGQSKKTNPVSTFTPPSADSTPTYQSNSNTNSFPSNDEVEYQPTKSASATNYSSSSSSSSSSSNSSSSSSYSNPKPKSSFPLKKGSKGIKVKELQDALISTHGKSILPKYGADGDFGSEMLNALKKLKYPTTVSESLFNVITGGTASQSSLAKQFYTALNKNDYVATMNLLKQLKTKTDYSTVSKEFLNYRVHGGVRQTLVNGTLNTFADKTQKQNIRLEFIRMGLKYNGTKWSLDGIGGAKIITIEPAQIWLDGYSSMQVPSNMILGIAHAEKLDFTLFENDNRFFLVKTSSIKKLS